MTENAQEPQAGPLSGIRVLDIATFIAAPFCGTLLAEFGADVIKIEKPGLGDTLRRFGTPVPGADTLVWASEARNKRSMTLDLRTHEGRDIFLRLVAQSDVILENFRPGTLEKWGLAFEALLKTNPRIVMLRVSGYGQTGPMQAKPGFARIAHAFGGLAHLAAEPGGKPVVAGSTSLADYMTGLFGAVGVLIALHHAQRTGEGQEIDIGLYESVFRVLDEMATVYAHSGFQREPLGADTLNVVPHSHYQSRDGAWIAIACTTDRMWQRMAKAVGVPGLDEDPRYATSKDRERYRDRINSIIADWVGRHDAAEVLAICDLHEAPTARLMTISDIFRDPQFAARENLLKLHDPRIGEIVIPAPLPRMSQTPPRVTSAGPALGNATRAVLGVLLGLEESDIVAIEERGII